MCQFPTLKGMLWAGVLPSSCILVGPWDAVAGRWRQALPIKLAPEHGCSGQGAGGITPGFCNPVPGISQALTTQAELR